MSHLYAVLAGLWGSAIGCVIAQRWFGMEQPLHISRGPKLEGRRWWAIYWNAHCVSLVPRWYGFVPVWRD